MKEEVEKILGRELTNLETIMFNLYKNNPNYRFVKDEEGNLKAIWQK